MRTSIHLQFDGNCREAFEFYRSVFGGEFEVMVTFRSLLLSGYSREGLEFYRSVFGGESEVTDLPSEDLDRIMHVALPIGDGRVMGADIPAAFGAPRQTGGNFAFTINPDSRDEARRIFHALAEGGSVLIPIDDTFWGGYFGYLKDRFGIQWKILFEESPN